MTPSRNVALMYPATTTADAGTHTSVFGAAADGLTGWRVSEFGHTGRRCTTCARREHRCPEEWSGGRSAHPAPLDLLHGHDLPLLLFYLLHAPHRISKMRGAMPATGTRQRRCTASRRPFGTGPAIRGT